MIQVRRAALPSRLLLALAAGLSCCVTSDAAGANAARAIHPVASPAALKARLALVPLTRQYPPDFVETLKSQGPAYLIETTSEPGCVPCADTWAKLQDLADRYGLQVRVLSREEAIVRSGKFGLPWVGHPVVWVRARADDRRTVPVAIGTDHEANIARNVYLAFKMIRGVRPAIAVRGMARFTGIVGGGSQALPGRRPDPE
jgi:hypothetical protein